MPAFGPALSINNFELLKSFFFDREAVMNANDRAAKKVLSRFGAYVRTRARTSMRRRKGISDPGQPPSAHTGTLKRLVLFAYDPFEKSVIIGPVFFKPNKQSGATVPQLLEFGGIARGGGRTIWVPHHPGGRDKKSYTGDEGNLIRLPETLQYRARPYMRPALAAERPRMPALLARSVK
jgi:hypothetical protein